MVWTDAIHKLDILEAAALCGLLFPVVWTDAIHKLGIPEVGAFVFERACYNYGYWMTWGMSAVYTHTGGSCVCVCVWGGGGCVSACVRACVCVC